ncbi:TRAP transporter large permease, partial [Sulfitobacter mediterraneus]|nr:TRAP transporter large permease [Sulfitobacter mediterraneus]
IAMTAFREPFGLIIRGVIPFILIMLFGLLVIAFVPQLSLMLVG